MPDKNQIKYYAWSSEAYFNGERDFLESRVFIKTIESYAGGPTSVEADVENPGSEVAHCKFNLSPNNSTVIYASCTCKKHCDRYGYCRHVCAALLEYSESENKYEVVIRSSPEVRRLIDGYNNISENDESAPIKSDISIDVYLTESYYQACPELSLKVGRDKKYIVRSLDDFILKVRTGGFASYGKNLAFKHCVEAFDEQSRKIFEYVAYLITLTGSYKYSDKRYVDLPSQLFKDFFDIYERDTIYYNNTLFKIVRQNPYITFNIEKKNQAYDITVNEFYTLYGTNRFSAFVDEGHCVMYLATHKFSSDVFNLYYSVSRYGAITIAESDIKEFCSSVISSVKDSAVINGLESIEKFIPPDALVRLYLDSPDKKIIFGKLEFTYGNETIPAFTPAADRLSDIKTEKNAEAAVLKYMKINEGDASHPLVISKDDDIYKFYSEGISYLNKIMEIYATDSISSMKIRQPVVPVIGITPGKNGLLTLNADVGDYDVKELIKLLASYKKGKKYHRLRDGSFVDLDSGGFKEFTDFSEALGISDKELLKKNISVPAYRMLYIDSLQADNSGFKIKKSKEFKNLVQNFKDSINSDFVIPENLTGIMRPYQEYGFKWLKTISEFGFGGILADDMGLGKTIESLALILSEKKRGGEKISVFVVAPSSLVLNWESEIKKFAPSLKYVCIIGPAAQREKLISEWESYDILITSYASLLRDIQHYENMEFDFQFADEAQYIKNHSTQCAKSVKAIKARVKFALTGTPVENSLTELWSIFDFIMPGFLHEYSNFRNNFEIPVVKNSDEKKTNELVRLTSPFILRRLKKDVLTELPDKIETTLTEEMTDEQKKLYTANVLSIKKSLKEKLKEAGVDNGKIEILAMLTRLRQICCDPSLVYENYNGGSAKLECCMELIHNSVDTGHKILLFSQFTSMLSIIEDRLKKENISYFLLTGATKPTERIRLVNEFNNDSTQVFMISLKAGGTGLNLTGADVVIHYDPWWNVSAENQATDRAYRIGQKNSVAVYKLIMKNSIEENIQKLQESKRELAELAVSGDGSIMRMSAEDIMSILE